MVKLNNSQIKGVFSKKRPLSFVSYAIVPSGDALERAFLLPLRDSQEADPQDGRFCAIGGIVRVKIAERLSK